MIWFTMLNVLKKVTMMTMSTKQQDISERALDHSGRDKNSHILKHWIEKEHLARNTRILKLLVVASIITLRRENYQRHRELTLLGLPKTGRRILFLLSFFINVFSSLILLIYLLEVSILTLAFFLCLCLFDKFGQLSSLCIVSHFTS